MAMLAGMIGHAVDLAAQGIIEASPVLPLTHLLRRRQKRSHPSV
jgi:hypothetical protein